MTLSAAKAVTFDFGQTLADLDVEMLSRRLGERGVALSPERLEGAVPAAWEAYNSSIKGGAGGHPWKILMTRLFEVAEAPTGAIAGAVDWLWTEQPRRNLWRRPVPGMIDVARDLRRAGVPIGVLSNSEGKLAELIEEIGWSDVFPVVADSGKLGMEKPDRAIFDWTAAQLGVATGEIVHIGDAHAADVEGALKAGARAIWFRGDRARAGDDRLAVCQDAAEVRSALAAWGIRAAG